MACTVSLALEICMLEVNVTLDDNHFIDFDADYMVTVGSWSRHMCAYKHAAVKWEREGISRWVQRAVNSSQHA